MTPTSNHRLKKPTDMGRNTPVIHLAKPGFSYRVTCLGGDGREMYAEYGVTLGPFLLLLILIVMYWFYRQKKIKRKDYQKIERFLEDYKALKPARYSYADIKKITNKFKDKVGQGGYGTVYRGQLSNDVCVAFLPNDSLEKFASSNHKKRLLGWKKLLEIPMGIAEGIKYLHQRCDQQILHFNIKPHNILLDDNLNPKISDFGQVKLYSKEQSVVSMTTAKGTIGYIAPEVFSRTFENVSYKSDIYSFGMLLLEMLGGKKNFDDEGDAKIVKKLAIVGLWCIQWYPVDRPSMHGVIQLLEGDGDTLIKPPNPFVSSNPTLGMGQLSGRPFNELEVIVESE
ncbi:hypothetical protein RHSIM_Rhsim03G0204300 [Rhododendron simsii]|uniref:non-specific serine/threonine protein kinase n=1 Tax=Rhododendron simsii TaxID=118357 RepID=A0A834H7Z0_RHOSS|nr:hypothetical protein RHSIM_Rhsim03G0204300 [Rhododendron simsii]